MLSQLGNAAVYFGGLGLLFTGFAWVWERWAAHCDRKAKHEARGFGRGMRGAS